MIREEIILSYLEGKDILDIGSIGQDMDFFSRELLNVKESGRSDKYYLWDRMKMKARSLTGIDTEPPQAESIVQGNMETYDFKRQFDLVVAGDVLEHVDNQGLFLRNIHRHLREEGLLILTTPNAKWPTVMLKPNPTHTLWHDRYTLDEILSRCGFDMIRFLYYYGNKPYYNWVKRVLTLRQQMLVVCRKKQAAKK